jgi:lipopolysaccharide biosynthesis glycosyltransferase
MTLPIYIGFDPRQFVSYTTLHSSILAHAKKPIAVTPLVLETLPITRAGLTPFTYSRFLVPWLQGFQGWALFMDSDVLVLGDVAELFANANDKYALMVVKNPKRFEWASVILYNCAHPANRVLTPDFVQDEKNSLFKFEWLGEDQVGSLPREWNHLVGYDAERSDAKLIHYTMGVPAYPETMMCEYAKPWAQVNRICNSTMPWEALMGNSVHAAHLPDGRVLPRFHPDVQSLQKASA